MVEKAILPNNSEICKIIKEYSHLISGEDSLAVYLDFTKHAISYEIFQEFPNELYLSFPYPKSLDKNVSKYRNILISEITEINESISKRMIYRRK